MVGKRVRWSLAAALLVAAAAQADVSAPTPVPPPVRATVDAWLDAQNRGDYAAYSQLYADPFHGVRRSGPRVVELDRPGWLADRRRMFRRPMVVSVADVGVFGAAAATRVEVRFTQRFASGSYADRGAKRMVLTSTDGAAWKIAEEELLDSQKEPEPPAAPSAPAGDAHAAASVPANDEHQQPRARRWPALVLESELVVSQDCAEDCRPPDEDGTGERYRGLQMRQATETETSSDVARAWTGQRLALIDGRGKVCAVEVQGVASWFIGSFYGRCPRKTPRLADDWKAVTTADVDDAECVARSHFGIPFEARTEIHRFAKDAVPHEQMLQALGRGDFGPLPADPSCTIFYGAYRAADGSVAVTGGVDCPRQATRLFVGRLREQPVAVAPPKEPGQLMSLDPRALDIRAVDPKAGRIPWFLVDLDRDGQIDLPRGARSYLSGADGSVHDLEIPALSCAPVDDC